MIRVHPRTLFHMAAASPLQVISFMLHASSRRHPGSAFRPVVTLLDVCYEDATNGDHPDDHVDTCTLLRMASAPTQKSKIFFCIPASTHLGLRMLIASCPLFSSDAHRSCKPWIFQAKKDLLYSNSCRQLNWPMQPLQHAHCYPMWPPKKSK